MVYDQGMKLSTYATYKVALTKVRDEKLLRRKYAIDVVTSAQMAFGIPTSISGFMLPLKANLRHNIYLSLYASKPYLHYQ